MARRSLKKFDFGKGIWYFNINKGVNNNITIKRVDKIKAMESYAAYRKSYKESCEWLGKWDGKKFTDDNYEKLLPAKK